MSDERETLLITREALDNFALWVREAQQLRVILTDLIAELQDHYENCTDCGFMEVAADLAEARLREVTDTSGAASRSGPEE